MHNFSKVFKVSIKLYIKDLVILLIFFTAYSFLPHMYLSSYSYSVWFGGSPNTLCWLILRIDDLKQFWGAFWWSHLS